jgi:tetratricopeptide (TPR) repeat protein
MKKIAIGAGLMLVAAAAAAFLLRPKRTVTTSSPAAYAEYLAGQEDKQRMYSNDAERHFRAALEKDPRFMMAMVELAALKLGRGSAETKELLDRAERERDGVTRRERLAFELLRALSAGKQDEATALARTLKEDYRDPLAYETLSRVLLQEGKTEEAQAIYRDWLRASPNEALAYNNLGYSAAYRGDYDEAIADLKKYAYLAPDQANPFDSLGEIETGCGRYEDAIADFQHALRIKPDFDPSWQHLGLAYQGKGDFTASRDAYEKAWAVVKSEPERMAIGLDLFYLTITHGDREAAKQALDRVAALHPEEYPNVAPILAPLLVSAEGRPRAALAQLDALHFPLPAEARKRESIEKLILEVRAYILRDTDRTAESAAAFEKVIRPLGKDRGLREQLTSERCRAELARLKLRMGDRASARALIETNRRVNPRLPETLRANAELEAIEGHA